MTISRSKKEDADPRDLDAYFHLWDKIIEIHFLLEDLKQKRIAHFVPIQLAIGAAFGLCIERVLGEIHLTEKFVVWTTLSLGIQIFALFHANVTFIIDRRAVDYIKTVKGQVRNVEQSLKKYFPNVRFARDSGESSPMLSYEHQQFMMRRGEYNLENNRDFPDIKNMMPSTHSREQLLIAMVRNVWIVLIVGTIGFIIWRISHLFGVM